MQTVPLAKKTDASTNASLVGLDPLMLAGTLCARLCHDLAGSLGALTGTLEMAADDGDREALRLSVALSQELSARLRLLRAAWGIGSDLPALETLLPGLPGADRLRMDVADFSVTDEDLRRLSLNLLVVAGSALPRGGLIRLSGSDARIAIEIEGQRAGWPEVLGHCLAGDRALQEACEVPRSMAVALACLQARAMRWDIVVESPTRLVAHRD
jgi:histidine phosphotransferase ChpT